VSTDATKVYADTSGNSQYSLVSSSKAQSLSDVTVQADVKVTKFGGTSTSYCAGISSRHATGSQYGYTLFICGNGALLLTKQTNSNSAPSSLTCTLGSASVSGAVTVSNSTTNWVTLKLSVATSGGGALIQGWVGGVQKLSCTVSSGAYPAGSVGVGAFGNTQAEFDNVLVTSP
jgi:hypothetical protein